jgi:hypothetical protein
LCSDAFAPGGSSLTHHNTSSPDRAASTATITKLVRQPIVDAANANGEVAASKPRPDSPSWMPVTVEKYFGLNQRE